MSINGQIEDCLTALPYYDEEYNLPGVAEAVESLIAVEMSTFKPSPTYLNYLAERESKKTKSKILINELLRIERGKPQELFEVKRYEVHPPPTSKLKDLYSWKKSLQQAEIQYEHQMNRFLCFSDMNDCIGRVINLELLLKYGKHAWLAYLNQEEKRLLFLKKHLSSLQEQIQNVNLKRMKEQKIAGLRIKELEENWTALLTKNLQIQQACYDIEKKKSSTF